MLLSSKARERGWDLLVFNETVSAPPYFCHLAFGLNTDKFPLNGATLYRWLRLCIADASHPIQLHKCVMETFGVLNMHSVSVDGQIEEDDTPVEPGTYLVKSYIPIFHSERCSSVAVLLSRHDSNEEWKEELWPAIDQTLLRQVESQGRNRCIFTMDPGDTPVWIMSPGLVEKDLETHARGANNLIYLRKDIAPFYMKNEIGIDVDDGHRVVNFGSTPLVLQSHAQTPTEIDGFLRAHFSRCIQVQCEGGDIHDQYSYGRLQDMWDEYEETGFVEDAAFQEEFITTALRLKLESHT